MHRLYFTTKRVWLGVGRFYWRRWEKLGLTHARYDFLLFVEPSGEKGVTQAEMSRALCVSRAATSKMARLLEKLKLLRREYVQDRRTLTLRLTDRGRKAFLRARAKVTRPFVAQKLLEEFFDQRREPRRAVADAICDLEWIAYGIGAPVGDYVYPGDYPHPHLLSNDRLRREHAAAAAPVPAGSGDG